jgi:hypothetical protein
LGGPERSSVLTRSAKLGVTRPQLPDLPADVGMALAVEDASLLGGACGPKGLRIPIGWSTPSVSRSRWIAMRLKSTRMFPLDRV